MPIFLLRPHAGGDERSGSFAITGIGVISATGDASTTGTFTITGVSSVAVTGRKQAAGTIAVTGIGSVSAAGTHGTATTLSVSAVGTVSISGRKAPASTLAVSGVGTITATGTGTPGEPITLTAVGAVSIAGTKHAASTLSITGIGRLTLTTTDTGAMVTWSIDLETSNGTPVEAGSAFASARFIWTVDGPGAVEIDLLPAHISTNWQPGTHRVVANIGGVPVWAGYLTRMTRSGPPDNVRYRASGIGLGSILDYRLVRHAYSITDTLDDIVYSLLDEAQTQYNGDMDFTEGTVVGTLPSRTRGYCFGVVIGDAIRELATVGKGFDWEVDATGALNIWKDSRGTDLSGSVSLVEGSVQDWQVECDTSDLLTTVSAIGDRQEPFGPRHTMARTGLATTYGRREIGIDVPTTDEDELYDAATAELTARGGALLRVRTMWIDEIGPWEWGDVWLQDIVSVETEAVFGGTQDMRVIEISCTLDPGLQRYVEYTFEALVGDITQGDPDDAS